MPSDTLKPTVGNALATRYSEPPYVMGILFGIVMPILSAIIYPTYTYRMSTPGAEWTRLIELPFVVCEAGVIGWALFKGLEVSKTLQSMPKDLKAALVLLMIGITLSSVFISKRPADSIIISMFTVIHLLFFLSVLHLICRSTLRDLQNFAYLSGFGLLALIAMTAVRFGFPPPASQVEGGQILWSSALPGFINVRHFGSWTGAVCAAFLIMALKDRSNSARTWHHFFYFVSAALTIWSGTRAAILALAISVVVIVAMNRELPKSRPLGILAMLTGAALITAWLFIPTGDSGFQLFNTADVSSANNLTGGRLAIWKATYVSWLDSPLLGWGSGSTFWQVFAGWTHTQPHNVVLQFLISWGLIGALGGLWLLGRAIVAAHKKTVLFPELQPFFAILFTLLFMSLLEGMLHYPRFITLILVMFAIIFSHQRSNEKLDRGDIPEAF
jgi:exopolysaccharide production protein ExoQ